MKYPVLLCGDEAVTVVVGDGISPEIHEAVSGLCRSIRKASIPGIRELVPTYCTVCVHYDPDVLPFSALRAALEALAPDPEGESGGTHRTVELPVCYGGSFGPDLATVAAHAGLSPETVIARHAAGDYLVYMLGFLPGFAYLGGMDAALSCPRLLSPRTQIPAGSVGIAGGQTGIYPLRSPGGWQLIGQTPVKLFTAERGSLLSAGDHVRFVPISEGEYRRMEEANQ